MKSALCVVAIIVSSALCSVQAQTVTYQTPTEFEITGHYCGRPAAPLYKVLGPSSDGTKVLGLVWAWTSCSAGGRGSGNSYWSGCDDVVWMPDGQLISYENIWIKDSRNLPQSSDCFGTAQTNGIQGSGNN